MEIPEIVSLTLAAHCRTGSNCALLQKMLLENLKDDRHSTSSARNSGHFIKRQIMNISLLCFAALSLTIVAVAQTPHALGADLTKKAQNPILWADVPDIAMIRVGDTYYMSS